MKIINAILCGSLSLSLRFSLTPLDAQGFSCIHWAVKRGDYEILRELYEYGADMEMASESESRMKPIHWAGESFTFTLFLI